MITAGGREMEDKAHHGPTIKTDNWEEPECRESLEEGHIRQVTTEQVVVGRGRGEAIAAGHLERKETVGEYSSKIEFDRLNRLKFEIVDSIN